MSSKDKYGVLFAEFLGTFMLSMAVLVVASMFSLGTAAWYISVSAGAALALIVAKLGHVSGAHVNPAVTIGLWTLKKINTTNAVAYVLVQLLAGIIALSVYKYLTGETLTAVSSSFEWRVFWAEALGAAVFGAGILAAVSQKMEGLYASFTIGASLTAGALLASLAAAGFLNPAVALANNSLSMTYVIAPIIGMVAGMQMYSMFFAPTKKSK